MGLSEGLRLGDLVDDYCPRCKLLLNHAVASMMESQVVKVICKTCYTEHAFRHGQGGKKKTLPRSTLFDQVLANSAPETEDEPQPAARSETRKKRRTTATPARYIARRKPKPAKKP